MAHSKLYVKLMNSAQWQMLRGKKLAENPLCERCKAKGYITSSRCVHHIIEVESGRTEQECMELCYRWSNLQALCFKCHAEIHKAARSHGKDVHQQRENERLQRWIERNSGTTGRPSPTSGLDFNSDSLPEPNPPALT